MTEAQANGTMFDPNTPEGVKAVATKVMELQKTQDAPVTDSTKARTLAEASERLANLAPGEAPDPKDLALLPSVNAGGFPRGKDVAKWLESNTTGGWTKINGTPYQVIKGDTIVTRPDSTYLGIGVGERTDQITELRDADGNSAWLLENGTITTTKPTSK
jgi:hypothetical protein